MASACQRLKSSKKYQSNESNRCRVVKVRPTETGSWLLSSFCSKWFDAKLTWHGCDYGDVLDITWANQDWEAKKSWQDLCKQFSSKRSHASWDKATKQPPLDHPGVGSERPKDTVTSTHSSDFCDSLSPHSALLLVQVWTWGPSPLQHSLLDAPEGNEFD